MSTLLAEPATARTSILLTPTLKEAAVKAAKSGGVSLGHYIRQLLAHDLEARRETEDAIRNGSYDS